MKGFRLKWLAGMLVLAACAFLTPSIASAAPRYATPTPDGVADCSVAHPCSLQTAVEAAGTGDEVIVNEGTYNESNQLVAGAVNISIHGAAGQQRPVIDFGALGTEGFVVTAPGTSVRRLEIRYGGTHSAFKVSGGTGVGEQVVVTTATGDACELDTPSYTLRDSVCSTTATGLRAALAVINFSSASWAITLRNANAVASGSSATGIYVSTSGTATAAVDAKNVIASGGSGSSDIKAFNGNSPTASSTVTLSHSNYDTECELVGAPAACGNGAPNVTITDPGANNNQTAAPVFADSDFHQAASSPTIDNGATDGSTGTADIDGDARSLGLAPDIGADEFVPPDSDGDGVPDPSDACPNEPGPASNNGCPLPQPPPDSDGDGVPDANDACPNEPGPASNNGCPEPGTRSDTDPPETRITKHPANRIESHTALFKFGSDERGSSFKCKLDRKPFRACKSPKRYRNLAPGKHVFRVKATDAAGNTDPSAARDSFRVLE